MEDAIDKQGRDAQGDDSTRKAEDISKEDYVECAKWIWKIPSNGSHGEEKLYDLKMTGILD